MAHWVTYSQLDTKDESQMDCKGHFDKVLACLVPDKLEDSD